MNQSPLDTVKGFLIDLDGVLYVRDSVLDGAVKTVSALSRKAIPHLYVTNTSIMGSHGLVAKLRTFGIDTTVERILTAPMAAAAYLRDRPTARCYFLTRPEVMEDFGGIQRSESDATHVVVGDVGERFSYQELNRVFRMLMTGAELLALQKNRYWLTPDGLTLDAGAFVAALEYASDRQARVFGKPAGEFFEQACKQLNLHPSETAMIGDDLRADILGAREAGLKTIFVRTGKDGRRSPAELGIHPDIVLDSIADLRGILDSPP
jgi:HAD superfamily hydrolase (TIGR01458 family)